MGGSIAVRSVVGRGSEFTVRLPLPPCPTDPEELAEEFAPPVVYQPSASPSLRASEAPK